MSKITRKYNKDCIEVIYRLGREDWLNKMELDIVSKCEIPYILPETFISGVTGKKIVVRVEHAMDFLSYLKSGIGFSDFLRCVRQVLQTVKECESHGVRSQNLYFNLENCFVDVHTSDIKICFWPVLTLEEYSDVEKFLHEMAAAYLPRTEDEELFELYSSLFSTREKFDTLNFAKQLNSLFDRNEYQSAAAASLRTNMTLRPLIRRAQGVADGMDFPKLLRTKTNTVYVMHSFPFTLGRAAEDCDCVISDNPYLGRRHITFLKLQEKFYVRDEGAKNESIIDGEALRREQKAPLHDGSILLLGGEEFVFFLHAK